SASLLENQIDTPADDAAALISRVRADEQRLIGALYSVGHYGGSVSIAIAGQRVADILPGAELRLPPNPVPIEVTVYPGPKFHFGRVTIQQPSDPQDPVSSNPADYGMRPGRVARSSIVLAAEQQLVNS